VNSTRRSRFGGGDSVNWDIEGGFRDVQMQRWGASGSLEGAPTLMSVLARSVRDISSEGVGSANGSEDGDWPADLEVADGGLPSMLATG